MRHATTAKTKSITAVSPFLINISGNHCKDQRKYCSGTRQTVKHAGKPLQRPKTYCSGKHIPGKVGGKPLQRPKTYCSGKSRPNKLTLLTTAKTKKDIATIHPKLITPARNRRKDQKQCSSNTRLNKNKVQPLQRPKAYLQQ